MAVDPDPFQGLTGVMWCFLDRIERTDRDWRRFVRALRRAYSAPPPLCIDGHEYRRRQKRRTKRKRRR